ncbi:MAG TPA: hypothetical protein PKN59_09250, partial [Syntrophales bacterium]|nr:hypothetical protein [Syntrophales bacterium]
EFSKGVSDALCFFKEQVTYILRNQSTYSEKNQNHNVEQQDHAKEIGNALPGDVREGNPGDAGREHHRGAYRRPDEADGQGEHHQPDSGVMSSRAVAQSSFQSRRTQHERRKVASD